MKNLELYLKNLTAKDETKASEAASYLINEADTELFRMLVDKSEFLFEFIKNNVCKRIEKSVTENNHKNIVKFFDIYSQDYDDLFARCLAKFANEDLTDEILELLEKGTEAQKTYAAKYFNYIPDTIATEPLSSYAFSDNEALSSNSAQALGQMGEGNSYSKALELLHSDDDFDKLKAVKFFCAYKENPPINELFNALKKSAMPENIAGEIPYLVSLRAMIHTENQKNVLITLDNILSGLGEILPLSQVLDFELYEILEDLIKLNKEENHYKSKIAEILLKSLTKFEIFANNDEYNFDEDQHTKNELKSIYELLKNQPEKFWDEQKTAILKELSHCQHRIISALQVIKDIKLVKATDEIKKLLSHENEIVICESVAALAELGGLKQEDILAATANITNDNIKAIINNYWSQNGT